jgi:hypothetical protein
MMCKCVKEKKSNGREKKGKIVNEKEKKKEKL